MAARVEAVGDRRPGEVAEPPAEVAPQVDRVDAEERQHQPDDEADQDQLEDL